MRKTKLLTLLLVLVMIVACLAACDGNTAQTEGVHSTGNSEDSTSAVGSESAGEDQDNSKDNTKSEISFTELLVVDNDECTIKITGIEENRIWGYTLNVQLENKSAEKTYMYSVVSASINGVQCDPLFATEVAAGKKSNKDIHFSNSSMKDNDIGDYTDIELTFRVYDSNDWLADDVARETVHVYPYGKDKVTNFVREPQTTDNVIVDNDYITVIVTGYEEDAIWGYTVNIFVLNKTDKDIMLSVDEASINGYMADPFFASEVMSGKCKFTSISWRNSKLEENNITVVEEIEFNIRAYDSDNWLAEDFVNEIITLNP